MNKLRQPHGYETHHFKVGTPEEAVAVHSRGDFVDAPEKYHQEAIIDDYVTAIEDHVRGSIIEAGTDHWDSSSPKMYVAGNIEVWWDYDRLVAEVADDLELPEHFLEEAWLKANEPTPEGGIDFEAITDRHALTSDAELIAQLIREGFPNSSSHQSGMVGSARPPLHAQQLTRVPAETVR